jgi:hypothetical protein
MKPPLLATAVDLHAWLSADQAKSQSERVDRDRAIGVTIGPGDPMSLVLSWWQEVGGAPNGRGQSLCRLRGWIALGLFGVGILMGVGIASVALGYEGDYPVNLVALLGVLVVLPGMLLIITVVATLARAVGARRLSELLTTVNINRAMVDWWTRLAGDELVGSLGSQAAARRLAHWQLIVFSQWMTIGFFAGALGTTLVLVALTDIAFGWSTTLEVDALGVHRAVEAIALPWATWLPSAMPDASLVVESRFYRLVEEYDRAQVARLGDWWPFVMMTTLVWGLLPRVLALGVARWRLHAAERALLLDHPGVTALLDRLTAPEVAFLTDAEFSRVAQESPQHPSSRPLEAEALHISWNHAGNEFDSESLDVGAWQTDDEQRTLLERDAAGAHRIVVFTKSWEPPLLDFFDFLGVLRRTVGDSVSVRVVPIGLEAGPATSADLDVWAAAIKRHGDAKTYVEGVA